MLIMIIFICGTHATALKDREIDRVFDSFDLNGDGYITRDEYSIGMKRDPQALLGTQNEYTDYDGAIQNLDRCCNYVTSLNDMMFPMTDPTNTVHPPVPPVSTSPSTGGDLTQTTQLAFTPGRYDLTGEVNTISKTDDKIIQAREEKAVTVLSRHLETEQGKQKLLAKAKATSRSVEDTKEDLLSKVRESSRQDSLKRLSRTLTNPKQKKNSIVMQQVGYPP